jgi:hypothetical protein
MGRKSPPPPTIIMPPPPPPPQVITDVTPKETYQDASAYLNRIHNQTEEIARRRWNRGETDANIALRHADVNLRHAERSAKWANRNDPAFGAQSGAPNLGGTSAILGQLAPPQSGSTSRDARIRPGFPPSSVGPSIPSTPNDRLAAAQQAYAKALSRKDNEEYYFPEFQEPSWKDRDWYDTIKKWDDRSEKVEIGDATPKIIS